MWNSQHGQHKHNQPPGPHGGTALDGEIKPLEVQSGKRLLPPVQRQPLVLAAELVHEGSQLAALARQPERCHQLTGHENSGGGQLSVPAHPHRAVEVAPGREEGIGLDGGQCTDPSDKLPGGEGRTLLGGLPGGVCGQGAGGGPPDPAVAAAPGQSLLGGQPGGECACWWQGCVESCVQ